MKRSILLLIALISLCTAQENKILSDIATNPLEVEKVIENLKPADRCMGLLFASQALMQKGDLALAEGFLVKATEIAAAEDNPDLMGRSYYSRGMVAENLGKSDDSIRFYGKAAEAFAKIKQYEALLETASRKAVAEERQGRIPAALETLTLLQMEALAGGGEKALADASVQKCRLHTILNQLPEAKQAFGLADSLLKPQGKPADLARLDMLEAGILGMEGKADRAVEMYNTAFRFYAGDREYAIAANCRFNAAIILSGEGKHERSNALLVEAAFHYAQSGSPTGTANAIAMQGANYLDMRNLAVAKVLLEQGAAMQEMGGNLMRAGESQFLLGVLQRHLGDAKASEMHLAKATDYFRKCGLEEEGLKRSRATRKSVPLGKTDSGDPKSAEEKSGG